MINFKQQLLMLSFCVSLIYASDYVPKEIELLETQAARATRIENTKKDTQIKKLIFVLAQNRAELTTTTYEPYILELELDYREKQNTLMELLLTAPDASVYNCNHYDKNRTPAQTSCYHAMRDFILYTKAYSALRGRDAVRLQEQQLYRTDEKQSISVKIDELSKIISGLYHLRIQLESTSNPNNTSTFFINT
jgi:hypothetical protein